MKVLLVSCGDVATEAGLRFLAQGHEVTGWRRQAGKLPAEFTGCSVDLLDPSSWPVIDPETGIAVLTPVPATRDAAGYERSYLNVARQLAARVAAACPKLRRFIYVSSSAVIAGAEGQWVDESAPLAPARETSKILAQTETALASSGLPVTILRASGIYGPGRTRLIDLVRAGTAQLPAQSHWTNRIHRDDLAQAIVHVAALGSEAADLYLASDSTPAQLGEVYEFLAQELDLPVPPAASEAPARRAADRRLDNAKLLASGLQLQYPSYAEGYRDILAGVSARHR